MYQPDEIILKKYADLLVKFALNSGAGVRSNEVVQLNIPDIAKPLYCELLRAILESGAFPKLSMIATGTDRVFFKFASDEQLKFFPHDFKRAEADLIDHQISIIADLDPRELKDVAPSRLFMAMDSRRKFRDWLFTKEQKGKFTWTLALYGTDAMAKEAGMSLEEYWGEIIRACYLDMPDPVKEWQKIQIEQERVKKSLNDLEIEELFVESRDIALHVKLGKQRRWMGGNCRNIPSYELFISPDWRGTEGRISFDQPVYRYGNILRGVTLEFKDGLVVNGHAQEGQEILDGILARENARKIGEYSLTDKRFSRISRFMANTLFDENIGGKFGNTHIALGRAYKDSYTGDPSKPTKDQWEAWGYNDSPEHTDIVSTEDRTVTATLPGGSKKVIFKNGMFAL
jgi:aminopeptidase